MLKKLGRIALLLPLLASIKTEANCCNASCCETTCCDPEWNVYADWLYWKPRSQTLDYAIPSIPVSGDISIIEPSYQSGFRVGLYYECDSIFYDVFYARFHQNYSDSTTTVFPVSLSSTRVSLTSPFSNAINAEWSFDYDTVDILVGSTINNSWSCFEPYFFGGLKLVFLEQRFGTNFINITTPITVSQKTQVDAYGINFGLGMDYNLWSCLGFFSRLSGDLLLAKFDRTLAVTNAALLGGAPVTYENEFWNVVSAINFALGLQYDYTFNGCWCADLGIAVGYEIHHYYGISSWLNTFQGSGTYLRRDLDNLSVDGLFVRVSLGF